VRFVVPGEPVPKARPRMGRGGRVYTPARTVNFEKRVAICAANANPEIFTGSVAVRIWISLPMTKKQVERISRADLDNYAKAIMDAMSQIVYTDDRQVMRLRIDRVPGTVEGWVAVEVKPCPTLSRPPTWA